MKMWKEDLAVQIANVKANRYWGKSLPSYLTLTFSTDTTVNPADNSAYQTTTQRLFVKTNGDLRKMPLVMGSVNRGSFAGADPETLMLNSGKQIPGGTAVLAFVLRSRPWNQALTPQGDWVEMTDAVGGKVYPTADFDEIP